MKILLFLIASLVAVQAKKYNDDKEIFASEDRNTVVRVERIEGKLISQVYQFSEKKQTLVKVHTLTLEERMMPLNVDIA